MTSLVNIESGREVLDLTKILCEPLYLQGD